MVRDYLLTGSLPLFWCPGCGNGIVLGALLRAFSDLGLRREQIVIVTGIGCFGKADDYINTNAVHGTHGRALPIATGIKAHRPELTVVALMGDGDCATIGGNHLIHAARRNVGVLAIVANNRNYGMTGGQASATTPDHKITVTSPYGNPESELDLCAVAAAAGAGFVARSTVYHARQTEKLINRALQTPGFGFVEVMSSCPVYYGRFNKLSSPVEMMEHWRDAVIRGDDSGRQLQTGILVDNPRDDFARRYEAVREAAAGAGDASTTASSR